MEIESFTIKELLGEVRRETRLTNETLISHMGREESQLENILLENKKTNGRVSLLEEHYHLLSIKHETIGLKVALLTTFISFVVAAIVTELVPKIF